MDDRQYSSSLSLQELFRFFQNVRSTRSFVKQKGSSQIHNRYQFICNNSIGWFNITSRGYTFLETSILFCLFYFWKIFNEGCNPALEHTFLLRRIFRGSLNEVISLAKIGSFRFLQCMHGSKHVNCLLCYLFYLAA